MHLLSRERRQQYHGIGRNVPTSLQINRDAGFGGGGARISLPHTTRQAKALGQARHQRWHNQDNGQVVRRFLPTYMYVFSSCVFSDALSNKSNHYYILYRSRDP